MSAGALALAFGLTAALYALAGFAGGSTYLALLALSGMPYHAIAPMALACNLAASANNSQRYLRAGLWRPRLLLPHMLPAIPMALLGGATPIGKEPFTWLAAISLALAGALLLWRHRRAAAGVIDGPPPLPIAIAVGAALGYLSGVIGIGGGIFLAPLLYHWRAGSPPEIAATCSFFILANSMAGLVGQWLKLGHLVGIAAWWLPFVVLAGSAIGGRISLSFLSSRHIAIATALLLLAASAELFHTLL